MRPIHDLHRDEEGTFLVFFALALAVLLGMVALSFDLGRMASTQSEIQSFADSVALAAAGELDGGDDAITRARAAAAGVANQLIGGENDRQTFGEGDQTLTFADIGDANLVFLSSLDADDQPPLADAVTTDPATAAYVRVTVVPHTIEMGFASALSVLTGGDEVDAQVGATAVAGHMTYACDITPLMFCLPNGSGTLEEGQMIRLRAGGGGSGFWDSGNFGFLDVASMRDPNGPCASVSGTANITRCLLGASGTITQCIAVGGSGVSTSPGQQVGIANAGFNFRFDIYAPNTSGGPSPERSNPIFAPAPNTIRGMEPPPPSGGGARNWCDNVTSTTSMALPVGAEFRSNDALRFGSVGTFAPGTPDRVAYMTRNWGSEQFPTLTTRWAVYQAEIARMTGSGTANRRILPNPRMERGVAMCFQANANGRTPVANPAVITDPYRRVIVAAGVDCATNDVRGNTPNVPVTTFYEVFLTRPIGLDPNGAMSTSDNDIWGEVIGVAGGLGADTTAAGVIHDVVQLYR